MTGRGDTRRVVGRASRQLRGLGAGRGDFPGSTPGATEAPRAGVVGRRGGMDRHREWAAPRWRRPSDRLANRALAGPDRHGEQAIVKYEDVTPLCVQEFFAQLLAKDFVARADRLKGKFRSFLLAGLKNLLSHDREKARRLKRGEAAPSSPSTRRPWRNRPRSTRRSGICCGCWGDERGPRIEE